MSKKRFLRDKILDDMLEEIRHISGKTSESGFPTMIFSQAVLSLSELYETNKQVLLNLEKVIDQLREERVNPEIVNQVTESAAHLQVGLVTVHNALKKDVQTIVDGIENLRDNMEDS